MVAGLSCRKAVEQGSGGFAEQGFLDLHIDAAECPSIQHGSALQSFAGCRWPLQRPWRRCAFSMSPRSDLFIIGASALFATALDAMPVDDEGLVEDEAMDESVRERLSL